MKEDFNEIKAGKPAEPDLPPPDERDGTAAEKQSALKKIFDGQSLIGLTVTLFLITAVVAALLGFVNRTTAPIIARAGEKAAREAMAVVLPADEYVAVEGEAGLHEARTGGKLVGFACAAAPSGYGGPITMMVGVDLDGLVTGVSIVKMTETPGFGTRATSESWFLSQFAGQSAAVELGNGVDALSGATVTSRAIAGGVRIAVNQVLGYLDREGGGAP